MESTAEQKGGSFSLLEEKKETEGVEIHDHDIQGPKSKQHMLGTREIRNKGKRLKDEMSGGPACQLCRAFLKKGSWQDGMVGGGG
jgi:hypothetical protein